jgi:hypothetical protein
VGYKQGKEEKRDEWMEYEWSSNLKRPSKQNQDIIWTTQEEANQSIIIIRK